MAYIYCNPNPIRNIVGDCVIRGICILTNSNWEEIYMDVCNEGLLLCDMPSSNAVWSSYLEKRGYVREVIPNTCPRCYTVRNFCVDNAKGKFLLATGTHVIAVINGNYYDTWDSGDEVPMYYWKRGKINADK